MQQLRGLIARLLQVGHGLGVIPQPQMDLADVSIGAEALDPERRVGLQSAQTRHAKAKGVLELNFGKFHIELIARRCLEKLGEKLIDRVLRVLQIGLHRFFLADCGVALFRQPGDFFIAGRSFLIRQHAQPGDGCLVVLSTAQLKEAVNRGAGETDEQCGGDGLQLADFQNLLLALQRSLFAGFFTEFIRLENFELTHDLAHIKPAGCWIEIQGALDDVTAAFVPIRGHGRGPGDLWLGAHSGE